MRRARGKIQKAEYGIIAAATPARIVVLISRKDRNQLLHALHGNTRLRARFNGHVCVLDECLGTCAIVWEEPLETSTELVGIEFEFNDSTEIQDIYEFEWTSTLLETSTEFAGIELEMFEDNPKIQDIHELE